MASSCKKRRFRDPQSVQRSIENVRNAIPQTTRYKNRWGVRIFEDWQSGRENKAVMCESNPFSLDLQNLQNLETELCSMTARTLNFWLIKFVQEVCDKDGKPYPECHIPIRLGQTRAAATKNQLQQIFQRS